MAGNFDEKSGLIFSTTSWGKWGQTIEDVQIFVDVEKGTSPKEIKCKIGSKTLSVIVKGKAVLEVTFCQIRQAAVSLACGVQEL